MTDPKMKPEEPPTVSCDVCLKEIPKDLAKSEESMEYIYHFCGTECFDKWQHKDEEPEDQGEDHTS